MSWTNPWLLLGLTALAVPIIVHLFNLRRYRKVVFSNVRMLRAVVNMQARQKNLLQRLVLICRLLALILLVLAFAKPSFLQKAKTKSSTDLVCIFLDNSYSMSVNNGNAQAFELGRQAARSIVRAHPPGSKFCLLSNDPFRPLVFGNAEACLRMIDEETLFPGTFTLQQIHNRMQQLLSRENGNSKHAYLLSDFRKNLAAGWQSLPRSDIQAHWIEIPAEAPANISLDSVWLEAPVLQGTSRIGIRFRATNHSSQNLEEVSFRLQQGNSTLSSTQLNLPAGASISGNLQAIGMRNAPSLPFNISTTDEGFSYDNSIYFSVWPARGGRTVQQGAGNRWLLAMLKSSDIFQDTGAQTGLHIESTLRNFGREAALNLLQLSNEGACCVLIPDAAARPEELNQGLSTLGFPEFSNAQSGDLMLGAPAYEHPMLREVFTKTPENSNLGSCKRYFPTGGSLAYAEALQLYRDGNPAVLYRKTGKGCIMLFTMPWTEENREFLNSAIPLTLLLNGALRRNTPQPLYLNAGMGQSISLKGAFKEGKNWTLEFKGQKRIAETVPFEDAIRFYGGSSLREPGLYRILNPSGMEAGYLALNIPRAESDPALIPRGELSTMAAASGISLKADAWKYPVPANSGRNIRWLAAAVAFFLMAEMILLALRKKPAHVPTSL